MVMLMVMLRWAGGDEDGHFFCDAAHSETFGCVKPAEDHETRAPSGAAPETQKAGYPAPLPRAAAADTPRSRLAAGRQQL